MFKRVEGKNKWQREQVNRLTDPDRQFCNESVATTFMDRKSKTHIVPYEKLSPEALRGLIQEFVTRDGTDTGYTSGSFDENIDMVIRQLKRKEVFIIFDDISESANIVSRDYAKSILPEEKL
jgi:uncharacterized protein